MSTTTSQEAFASIKPVRKSIRSKILAFIRAQDLVGATCEEIELALGYKHQTASARICELRKARWIRASGRTRNRSGRMSTVWVEAE